VAVPSILFMRTPPDEIGFLSGRFVPDTGRRP